MKNQFFVLVTGIFFLIMPAANYAQIKVVEAEKSDTTSYSTGIHQDSIYIVYKGENNKSTITLTADLNGIDSLNFDWFKYNYTNNSFVALQSFDTVSNCTITYDNPSENMNKYEGGYRVNIHNQQKNIDTTFTIWLWYQDFFINSISVYNSTCSNLELRADTSFQAVFNYVDLSDGSNPTLSLLNETILKWTTDPGTQTGTGDRPRFMAPVEATSYILKAEDSYGFARERTMTIDETKYDSKGYPQMRAVKSEFSGIHGLPTEENKPSKDTAIVVEAPHGVWFYNLSQNAEEFEWVFYNHKDWKTTVDTAIEISTYFEPIDSIFYIRPPRDTIYSPAGYDVKLSVWGPVYNDNSDQCLDTIRKSEFVVVIPTRFPKDYKLELPNVFTPNSTAGVNDNFYFIDASLPKSIQYFSIKIYNRWGDKIYEYEDKDGSWHESGKSKQGWDGTTRVGTKAKPGVYYYTMLATGWDGKEFKIGGYVHIFTE